MEFALFISIALATLFLLLFISHYLLLLSKWQPQKQRLPLSPPGAWPVIGHLHMLRHAKLPHHALGAMADKYGPIFRLQLGTRSALVVSNCEMAKEAMWLNDVNAASRPSLSGTKTFSFDYALSGLGPSSPYWREMRKITNSELLSNHRVDMLKSVMLSEVDTSLRELRATTTQERSDDGSGRSSVELKSWFADVALNIVLKIVMGKRCVGPNGEGGEEDAREIQRAIKESFHMIGQGLLSDYFPLVEWLGCDREVKKIKKMAKRSDEILQGWLEEHKQKRSRGSTNGNGDFMDSLLSLFDDNKLPGFYDGDTITKATALNMISGGTESSTVTLTWAISLMLNNPHTLEKAQHELDAVVGRERRVNQSDITNLVYIQAIIKETMRLYPAAPLLGPREFLKDCMVAGYFVPKGTHLIPNIWKIQTDPRIWPDPFQFKPDRFLTTHKNVEMKGNHFELFPFGTGRRGCPGAAFGLQMVHFTLAGFLQSFCVENSTGDPIDMSETYGMATDKVTPLDVLLTPRLPSHLYAPNQPLPR